MSNRLTLKIPRRLESPNTWNGRHWRVKHRISQEWFGCLGGALRVWLMTCGKPVKHALDDIWEMQGGGMASRPLRVTVERQVPSARNFIRDDDNLRFAVKPLLDALKRQGYIRNDSRKWLEHPTPTQSVSPDGKDWTIVTIEPVADVARVTEG
jgi:hypothetical protein